jgi:hypothetical protein
MKPAHKHSELNVRSETLWIQGIHNYCDRWCERCDFTSQCRLFAAEATSNLLADDENEALPGAAGILNDQQWEDRELSPEQANGFPHPLAEQAMEYSDLAEEWIVLNDDRLAGKQDEVEKLESLGAANKRTAAESELTDDAIEVICWYAPQIWVKLMRALSGRAMEGSQQLTEPSPSDSDGSAKVALIGMDRSLAAWRQLQLIFPEETDSFITLLLDLDRLRIQTEIEFPQARSFVRRGFDDSSPPQP